MHRTFSQKNTEGFALLLSIIVASVVLAVGVSILHVSINQLNLSSTARESEISFQAAHAGLDCMQYWRKENATQYTAFSVSEAPGIDCFSGTVQVAAHRNTTLPDGYANLFRYSIEWGGDFARCTDMEMWVIGATNADFTTVFANPGVGQNGVKTCAEGNTCTVIFSRGFNRPCGDLESSIFSVQRELVLEY